MSEIFKCSEACDSYHFKTKKIYNNILAFNCTGQPSCKNARIITTFKHFIHIFDGHPLSVFEMPD